jgi:hypothetical protein
MRQALGGGELASQAAAPAHIGELHPGVSRDQGGTDRTQDPVDGCPDLPVVREEAIEDVECVELRQPQTGAPFPGEADVGHLGGGKHPMVLEQTAQVAIPFGDPTEHLQ